MSDPLVSIVIPAFNPAFFQAALHSARSQSYANIEIIVCDDSSSDVIERTFDALAQDVSVSARYLRNPRQLGFVGNVVQCLAQARGEFIKFLCDDDLLYIKCVERQANALARHGDASLVLAQRTFCDPEGYDLPERFENSPLVPHRCLLKGQDVQAVLESVPVNFLGNFSSALFRRADIEALLPVLTQPSHCFAASLDFALFVCLMSRGHLLVLNEVLCVERLHPLRLSDQQAALDAKEVEQGWLLQMLKERGGEGPPAPGWVHMVSLEASAIEPRVWEELALSRDVGTWQRSLPEQVGTSSQSMGELYREWLSCRTLTPAQVYLLPDSVALWPEQPRFVVLVVDEVGDAVGVEATLRSLSSQHYPPALVVVMSTDPDAPCAGENVVRLALQDERWSQINSLVQELPDTTWLYVLQAADCVCESSLLVMADRIAHDARAACLYGDEGGIEAGESAHPVFKPDFNLDLLRSYAYTGRILAFKCAAILECGRFTPAFGAMAPADLLWRIYESQGAGAIVHVSEVLVESALGFDAWLTCDAVTEQSQAVVAAHLLRTAVPHTIVRSQGGYINRVTYLHDQRPLVSIIIVSRDQLAAVQRCLESLLGNTAYEHFELLLVDNGSETQACRQWMAGMARLDAVKLRVLTADAAPIAHVLNAVVEQARGSVIVVASPYLVATEPQWLDELLQQALRPEVGAVGPLLFDAGHNIVHAGLILGPKGTAGPAFQGEVDGDAGYMSRLRAAQNLSAVGADCLVFRRDTFERLDGFDAAHFADGGYEVDFCLRAAESGLLTVWTPEARLALGAKPQDSAQAYAASPVAENLQSRWLPVLARDPAYNRNLKLEGPLYRLDPGLRKGWSPYSESRLPSILAIPMNASASGHYRLIQPFLELEAAGMAAGRVAYTRPSTVDIERQQPQVIIFQGRYVEGSPAEIRDIKRTTAARLIYELDDYPLEVPSKNAHVRKRTENLDEIVRQSIGACDRMVVSTQPLADAFAHMHGDIRVAPNMLTAVQWDGLHSSRQTTRKPRVGWGGGTSHTGDLELIADVVRLLADEVDWVFFGMCPPLLRPYVKEFHGLQSLAAYPAKLASLNLDLALAPLEFHIFNDCKSNLRLLEYGACGYPVICSDTLAYRGYLSCTRITTNSTEEWINAIRGHLADPQASYRQGDALREAVLRDYLLRGDNLQHWADAWLAP